MVVKTMTVFGATSALFAAPYMFASVAFPMAALPGNARGVPMPPRRFYPMASRSYTRQREGADVIAMQLLVAAARAMKSDDEVGATKMWERAHAPGHASPSNTRRCPAPFQHNRRHAGAARELGEFLAEYRSARA